MAIITLTTDFGLGDGYVGVMKGVILSIAPRAQLVDLSHTISAQDVRGGAFLLYGVVPFFPRETVHLVVVDPGVGTKRRAIALRTDIGDFVGPDNGLFTYILAEAAEWTAVELVNEEYGLGHVSSTFHGRDLFAPAAAYLANGLRLEEFGPPVDRLVSIPLPRLETTGDRIEGEVLSIDRFGNLVTSIGRLRWEGSRLGLKPAFGRSAPPVHQLGSDGIRVEIAELQLRGVRRTYGEVEEGELLALVGSTGFLEIAVGEGSAAEKASVDLGARVTLWLE
jgi:S-adenosylmethionine hydrolase